MHFLNIPYKADRFAREPQMGKEGGNYEVSERRVFLLAMPLHKLKEMQQQRSYGHELHRASAHLTSRELYGRNFDSTAICEAC